MFITIYLLCPIGERRNRRPRSVKMNDLKKGSLCSPYSDSDDNDIKHNASVQGLKQRCAMPQFSFYFLHWCAYNKTYKHKAEKSSLGRVFNQPLTYVRKIQRLRAAHVSQNQGCGYIKAEFQISSPKFLTIGSLSS